MYDSSKDLFKITDKIRKAKIRRSKRLDNKSSIRSKIRNQTKEKDQIIEP